MEKQRMMTAIAWSAGQHSGSVTSRYRPLRRRRTTAWARPGPRTVTTSALSGFRGTDPPAPGPAGFEPASLSDSDTGSVVTSLSDDDSDHWHWPPSQASMLSWSLYGTTVTQWLYTDALRVCTRYMLLFSLEVCNRYTFFASTWTWSMWRNRPGHGIMQWHASVTTSH